VTTEEQYNECIGQSKHTYARTWGTPASARRHRRMLTISLLAAILLFILDSTFGVSEYILSHTFPPRIQAPAANLFYFQALPFWGTVTLDGHRLAHLPSENTENPLLLTKGIHPVIWQAAPFPMQTCQLVVPPTNDEQSCPTHLVSYPNNFTPSALVVTPPQFFSLRLLPLAQQQVLSVAAQQRLDTLQGTDTVQTGETYQLTTDAVSIQQASQPMLASLRFILDTNTSRPANCQGITLSNSNDASCFIAQNDCRLFCTIQWPTNGSQAYWDVAAIIRSLYTYTAQAPPHLQESRETQLFVTFRISWQQQKWHVTFHQQGDSYFDDPGCHDTISTLVIDPRYQSAFPNHWAYSSGTNRAQGCVAVLQPNAPTQVVSSSLATKIILFDRFGVLLTASGAAAQKWPDLPAASPYERALAEAILRHPAFVS
jgi:hypothetical protein